MALQELPDSIDEKVAKLKREGDILQMGHKNLEAVEKFKQAYEFLPDPKDKWIYGTILPADVAQNYYLYAIYEAKDEEEKIGYLEKAIEYLAIVMSVPGNVGRAMYHFRVGKVRYELGDFEKAKDEFMRVYMADGKQGFRREDSKYFALIEPYL